MTRRLITLALLGLSLTACGERKPFTALADTPGAVCETCVAGGEASDFDSTGDHCWRYTVRSPVSDKTVEAAGVPATQTRAVLGRSFKSSWRWTDLTTTSAQTAAQPITGYHEHTDVSGTVRTLGWQREYRDPVVCPDGICTDEVGTQDCSHLPDRYVVPVKVSLETGDGAIQATLRGEQSYTANEQRLDAAGVVDFVHAWTDLLDVVGNLRVAPSAELPMGYVSLQLAYFADDVRGDLNLTLTNSLTDSLYGRHEPDVASSEQPLTAAFPDDGCETAMQPSAMNAKLERLGGKSPSEYLAELRQLTRAMNARAEWSDGTRQTELRIAIDEPEFACVDARGRITNVPLNLSTSDDQLSWSTRAA